MAVEVGVWRGLSATLIAGAMRARGRGGVLFAVDTWLGAVEFWNLRFSGGRPDRARDLHLVNGYPTVYYTFLSNVVRRQLSEYITPMPMTSRMAAQLLHMEGVKADLIHLDAAHEYNDIKEDIRIWLPLLQPCGILLGDDYMRDWPGVVRAADQLAAIGEFQVVRPKLPNATQGARANVDGRYGVKWWAQRVGCPRITLPA